MPLTFVNPYGGGEEETCSVSFASQAHTASVHDKQTEAQFNKSKFLGEWGVVKAKLAKGIIPSGTKVMTYETKATRGYAYVKDGKLHHKKYALASGNLIQEGELDEQAEKSLFSIPSIKFSIPKGGTPKKPASVIQQVIKKAPGQPITGIMAWLDLKDAGKAGKIPNGTIVAISTGGQERIVFDDDKFILQLDIDDEGKWGEFTSSEDPLDITSGNSWLVPDDDDATQPASPAPPPSQAKAKPMTKADAKAIQQSDSLKEGDILAVAKSKSGATQYRIVLGKENAFSPFLLMAKGQTDADFKKIDESDWFPDLVDDGNDWFHPDKMPEPVAAPTPKPAVPQFSTSKGSMSDEDIATMFVQVKDTLAKSKGLNIKGANPELDAEVHKVIGDSTGYTSAEVKAKIDAYKASGKKLSALKKKVLKGGTSQPAAKPKPVDPNPKSEPNGVPTKATKELIDETAKEAGKATEGKKGLYSEEDIAAAYVMAKDKVVAESGGKWTLYTKSEEMDKEIYGLITYQTGYSMAEAKHAIALYLSDPGNKLSKLKKSLIKQGKMKAEADTLKKKPTPSEVTADLNKKADEGYTPADKQANPEAPIATAPFEPRPKPPIDDLKWTGTTVGSHHSKVYSDKQGNQWLFKPQAAFQTEVDVATAKLAKRLGHPTADVYAATLDGKEGSLQRMFPGGQAFPGGLNPQSAPTSYIMAVQKEHVLDWLFANHDSHSANFVLDENGNVVGIDKGQALKFLGMDELHWSFHPNQFEMAHAKLYKDYADGKPVALNNPGEGELRDFIDKVKALPDDDLKKIFRPYAEAAAAKGVLVTGQHWKSSALKPKTIKPNDVEAFLDALVQRKNSLDKDFKKLWDKANEERAKHITPAASTAASVTNEPGDISHISEMLKESFKSHTATIYGSDGPEVVYKKLLDGIEVFKSISFNNTPHKDLSKLSVLQAVRIIDEMKAKKAGVLNNHQNEKKLVAWLTSPDGKKFFQDQKDKEEASKKAQALKDSQPDLPPDSAMFTDIELDEVRKWQSEQTPWTGEQESSLKHYTSNQGYTEMNGNLRGSGYDNPSVNAKVKNARAGMRPLHRPIVAHRGTTAISFGLVDNGSEDDLLYGMVGTKHRQVGFSSASYGSKAGFGSKPVIVHFECPAGTPAAFVRDISYYKHSTENEILLDHDIEVRILRVWEVPRPYGKPQIHVQVRVEGWSGQS